jgi:GNAT superfamily N-acetyltransferase
VDQFGLARKMRRLTMWLDGSGHAASATRRQFHGSPFGDAYVSIDPTSQATFASGNRNRVHLCGLEAGMAIDAIPQLVDLFTGEGVRRFFIWLSPGPDIAVARGMIEQAGLTRLPWTRYPTLCRRHRGPVQFTTDLDVRQVGAAEIAAATESLGETLWPEYLWSAGRESFFHYMAFDGDRPVAIAALCVFEDIGYLGVAATCEGDRKRGAQQALIATRLARAEALGCALQVSETLTMLEHSHRNLRRAGFEEVYDKEVYEWNATA